MGSFKQIVSRLAGLSSAVGTVAVSGRIGVLLVFGLITVLALTGTFGPRDRREAAQAVLAILLGRVRRRDTSR